MCRNVYVHTCTLNVFKMAGTKALFRVPQKSMYLFWGVCICLCICLFVCVFVYLFLHLFMKFLIFVFYCFFILPKIYSDDLDPAYFV